MSNPIATSSVVANSVFNNFKEKICYHFKEKIFNYEEKNWDFTYFNYLEKINHYFKDLHHPKNIPNNRVLKWISQNPKMTKTALIIGIISGSIFMLSSIIYSFTYATTPLKIKKAAKILLSGLISLTVSVTAALSYHLLTEQSTDCLNILIFMGLKSKTGSVVQNLFNNSRGFFVKDHAYTRAKIANIFFKETSLKRKVNGIAQGEMAGLTHILSHRANFLSYAVLWEFPTNTKSAEETKKLVEKLWNATRNQIQKDIRNLNNPQSERVINLGNAVSFVIPGGCIGHVIAYEFQKIGSRYFFLIHNTGMGLEDIRLHGPVIFNDQKGDYRKTTVRFETSQQSLMEEGFIDLLKRNTTMEKVYNGIYNYFIIHKKGQIIVTNEELQLEVLYNHYKKCKSSSETRTLKQQALAIIKNCPDFSRSQLYGTCIESSATIPERNMAPLATRRALRFYTLTSLVDTVKKAIFPESMNNDVNLTLVEVMSVLNRLKLMIRVD